MRLQVSGEDRLRDVFRDSDVERIAAAGQREVDLAERLSIGAEAHPADAPADVEEVAHEPERLEELQ
jgi:hypothetical protein